MTDFLFSPKFTIQMFTNKRPLVLKLKTFYWARMILTNGFIQTNWHKCLVDKIE